MTAREAFKEFIEANGLGIDPDGCEEFADSYRQEWESEEAFARYHAQNVGWGNVPASFTCQPPNGWEAVRLCPFEELESYIDWSLVARELFRHGPYMFIPNDEHPSRGYVFERDV